jgi:hypothetical protein
MVMPKSYYDHLKDELINISDIVKRYPENLQAKVLDILIGALDGNEKPESSSPENQVNSVSNKLIPITLKDLALKGIIKNESEWLLLIGYNLSNAGKCEFPYENIRTEYKSVGRDFGSNMSNYTQNFKSVFKKYFTIIDDKNAVINDDGKQAVQKIINRQTSVKNTKKKKQGKK